MVSSDLIYALTAARRRMTQVDWLQLAAKFAAMNSAPAPDSTQEATASLLSQDAAWILSEAFLKHDGATWKEIAVAMTTLDILVGDQPQLMEIIWTGPPNNRFPVRRIDQVLYDLIAKAQRRIVLVTFAAHRVQHLCVHLAQAVERGVELSLIVESEDESEGQLTQDAVKAFKTIPPAKMHIYYWPVAKRERNHAGRPGKLHMKCAIVDGVALIGSANLTDDAFNRNMELGLLVRENTTVVSIAEHFMELISRGVLVEIKTNE